MSEHRPIVTITGPSGAGKTVLSYLLRDAGFEPLVSTTTRLPRKGEINGVDYHFVGHAQFEEMKRNDLLIEHVEYDGNSYGVSAAEAQRAFSMGKSAVLVAEPHGVQQIHQYCQDRGWDVVRVFVTNPIELLLERLLRRFHDDTRTLDSGNPDDAVELAKKMSVYAARIQKVAGFEQRHWVEPAMSGETPYEVIVERFDADNQTDVLGQVQRKVASVHEDVASRPAGRKPGP